MAVGIGLLASTAWSAPKQGPNAARSALVRGIVAEIDGSGQRALRDLRSCNTSKAREADDCSLYLNMFAHDKTDGSKGGLAARRSLAEGMAAYRKHETELANIHWHDCLDASTAGTLERDRCLAAIDVLIPKGAPTPGAETYQLGMLAYAKGDVADARAYWAACAADTSADPQTRDDCRIGIERLNEMAAPGQK